MDEIYRNAWSAAGLGCPGSAAVVTGIGIAIVAVTMALIGWVGRRAILRAARPESRARSLRGIAILMLALAAVLSVMVVHVALTGTVLHSARSGGDVIALDYCDGVRARAERIAAAEVVAIRHRTVTRQTRNGVTHEDEAVISTRAGRQFAIPLRVDPSVTDPGALKRHLPAAVLDAWDAARRARGATPLPPEWRR